MPSVRRQIPHPEVPHPAQYYSSVARMNFKSVTFVPHASVGERGKWTASLEKPLYFCTQHWES